MILDFLEWQLGGVVSPNRDGVELWGRPIEKSGAVFVIIPLVEQLRFVCPILIVSNFVTIDTIIFGKLHALSQQG